MEQTVTAQAIPVEPAKGRPALAISNFCNNGALRRATRHLSQLFDDVLAPSGLRAAQHGLLYYIYELHGPTMKELAEALVMDLSALGHTLKPLARDGFVELVADERDRRAKRVFLTHQGQTKLAQTVELWRVAQQRVETVLGVDEARRMREMLATVASKDFGDAFRAGRPLASRVNCSSN